jgi:hypothetical protein
MLPDLSQYRALLVEAIQAAERNGAPARAAWLLQYLRRREVGFRLSDLGFANFRDFLTAVGGFHITHDGFDVVAAVASGGTRPPPDAPRVSRFERVDPALWRAVTRSGTTPAYLDLDVLRQQHRVAVVLQVQGADRRPSLLEIPAVSQHEQAEWLIAWATKRELPSETLTALREAIGAGGIPRAIGVLRDRRVDHEFLIDRVESTKERLRRWLSEANIPWAAPIVELARPAASTVPGEKSDEELRDVVHAALTRLPHAALRQLWLPVGVVFDVITEKRSR